MPKVKTVFSGEMYSKMEQYAIGDDRYKSAGYTDGQIKTQQAQNAAKGAA